MDTRELVKKLRIDQKDTAYDSELSSCHMALYRQLNHIFQGFGSILKNNRINYHMSYLTLELNKSNPEISLIRMIQEDIEYIIQMTHFVIELYYVNRIKEIKEYAKKLHSLYDQLLRKSEESPSHYLIENHWIIFQTYLYFCENAPKKYKVTWEDNYEGYDIIRNGFTEGFQQLTNEKYAKAFESKTSKKFHKNYIEIIEKYCEILYTKTLLGDNLTEPEIALLTFIIRDLGNLFRDPQRDGKDYGKLTRILGSNNWEKIDYSLRCRLWELIDGLIPRKNVSVTETNFFGEIETKQKTVCDYSIVNKYLRCSNEDGIRDRLAIIEQKIKTPSTYRILNQLTDIYSFFASVPPVEAEIAPGQLFQFEQDLSKLHKYAMELEQKYHQKMDFVTKFQVQCRAIYCQNVNKAINNIRWV